MAEELIERIITEFLDAVNDKGVLAKSYIVFARKISEDINYVPRGEVEYLKKLYGDGLFLYRCIMVDMKPVSGDVREFSKAYIIVYVVSEKTDACIYTFTRARIVLVGKHGIKTMLDVPLTVHYDEMPYVLMDMLENLLSDLNKM